MKGTTPLIFLMLLLCLLPAISQAANDSDWKIQRQMKLPAKASTLAYSSDGTRLAVGHPDGRVSIWEVASGSSIHVLNAHTRKVNSVQFILQDRRLLTIGDDNKARL